MTIMHISTLGAGVSFTGIGLMMRRQGKPWKAFFCGGLSLIVLCVLSLALGLAL
jgi:hypothetical protein